jgi:hypothetical protein
MRKATNVVERVDQALQHVGLPAKVRILALLRCAASIVVILGGQSEILLALFIQLRWRASILTAEYLRIGQGGYVGNDGIGREIGGV